MTNINPRGQNNTEMVQKCHGNLGKYSNRWVFFEISSNLISNRVLVLQRLGRMKKNKIGQISELKVFLWDFGDG